MYLTLGSLDSNDVSGKELYHQMKPNKETCVKFYQSETAVLIPAPFYIAGPPSPGGVALSGRRGRAEQKFTV
ncbi:hypothetical protein EYF80_023749 [Liparis tanakae]|uniref:Uncharacterized protein n=1 Tax=Liparis tanakae TaxID=230148 RepID=A0A4Z2HLX2_9TELE|nr:hypothetical protein EYF80_023749 [Liparis tanakae]